MYIIIGVKKHRGKVYFTHSKEEGEEVYIIDDGGWKYIRPLKDNIYLIFKRRRFIGQSKEGVHVMIQLADLLSDLIRVS